MDKVDELYMQKLKNARQLQLTASLSAWRVAEKADVTFYCGGKRFPVHKVILASCYPYFEAMFKLTPGPVISFKNMKPEILEAILDFVYLGEVTKISTEECAKEVLRMSGEMQIKELSNHCALVLQNFLSTKNAFELWDLALKCENERLKKKVMDFLVINLANTLQSVEFLRLPFDRLKSFVILSKSELSSMDDLLSGLVQWVLYDLKTREVLARTLFACVDSRLVSKKRLVFLRENKCIMQSSPKISVILSDLYEGKMDFDLPSSNSQKLYNLAGFNSQARITFFSEYCSEISHDPKRRLPADHRFSCGAQQFDLATMTWLPPVTPCAIQSFLNVTLCQWENYICVAGGGMDEYRGHYGLYNLVQNQVKYFKIGSRPYLQHPSMCYFKNHLYMIGGQDNFYGENALSSVICTTPKTDTWQETKPLLYPRCSPMVLTSEEFIYVIGGTPDDNGSLIIECNYSPDKDFSWQEIVIPKHLENGKYFIFLTELHVLCSVGGDCVVLSYDHNEQHWLKTKFSLPFPDDVTHIFQVPGSDEPFVYVSTNNDEFFIPTFLWEPISGKLTKLPSPVGQSRLAMVKASSASVWTTGI